MIPIIAALIIAGELCIATVRVLGRRVRERADHEPRALKLLEAPKFNPCLACGSDNDVCRMLRDTPASYFSFCRPKNTGQSPVVVSPLPPRSQHNELSRRVADEYERPVPVKMPIAGPGKSVRR